MLKTHSLLKVAIACIGAFAAIKDHRDALKETEIVTDVLLSARSHLTHAKLIKTALGCLINLSSINSSE
jgi:hypothetical protein